MFTSNSGKLVQASRPSTPVNAGLTVGGHWYTKHRGPHAICLLYDISKLCQPIEINLVSNESPTLFLHVRVKKNDQIIIGNQLNQPKKWYSGIRDYYWYMCIV